LQVSIREAGLRTGHFSAQGDGTDGALNLVVVDLDMAIGGKRVQANPVFGDVFLHLNGPD